MQLNAKRLIFRLALLYLALWAGAQWVSGAALLPDAPKDRPVSAEEHARMQAAITTLSGPAQAQLLQPGTPQLLYLFASWCHICARQSTLLHETKLAVPLRAVSLDKNPDALARTMAVWDMPAYAQVFHLPQRDYLSFRNTLATRGCTIESGVPQFLLLDASGNCRARHAGMLTARELGRMLASSAR